jgi:anaerobic selenocysteine-containing dehydrogenase
MAQTDQVHHRACNLCEAMCGVTIVLREGKVSSIRGDPEDPLSRGHVCPKAVALKDLHEDPDRLRTPLRRIGASWQSISWDAALDEAAQRLLGVQRAHGNDAVATYLGNPNVHNTGAALFGGFLSRALKTKNRYSATSVDQLPHQLVSYWMLGHQLLFPVPDLDRTQHFLILGANPLASNGSLMTAPGMRRRLDAIKARGGRVVVVDPRRTETAARADQHLFITPGTDALLLLSMLQVVLERGPRLGRLEAFTSGLEVLRVAVRPFPPERVAGPTGIAADQIRALALDFAAAPCAVAYGRVGTSMQAFGSIATWLVQALNIVTGNFDRAGGAMFPRPAFDPRTLPKALAVGKGSYGRWRSRVRGLPEAGGELPVATLADELLTPGPGQVRALVTVAGNPVLSTPNGRRLGEALAKLDFMVSIDPYLNETTRHAHLILPPPSPLERGHFDVIFHLLAVRDTVRYAPPLFEPGPNARHDWQLLLGLARRLEEGRKSKRWGARLQNAAIERLGPEGLIDLGLRLGAYGGLWGLTLEKVKQHPHGIDVGALQPALPQRLFTRDRRIQLAPAPLLADLARLERTLAASAPSEGLLLIGRRHLRDNNSWMHNVPRLVSGAPRCTLLMHPLDAEKRGLAAGDQVRVRSRVGEVAVPLELTAEMMRGVVSLPHGYGHGAEGSRLRVASAHPGASINDLTDERALDELSGNAAFSAVPVCVERAAAPARPS